MLPEAFKDSTVFVIAHKMSNVLDCDKIMVLVGGQIIEFDSPKNLLSDKNSVFSEMLSHNN